MTDPTGGRDGSALDRLDASEYGDPDEERPADVGPPCAYCERREAATTSDQGRPICSECLPACCSESGD